MNALRLTVLSAALSPLLVIGQVIAQVPVVELGGGEPSRGQFQVAQAPAPARNNDNELLIELYTQLEALQQEVQNLRGIVEEQRYQIRRMETEQRDRYLDLDRRLSAAGGGGSANQVTGSGENLPRAEDDASFTRPLDPNRNGLGIPTTVSAPDDEQTLPQGEQELYRSALNLLLETGDYPRSIEQFQQYIAQYPRGGYLTNAWYWLGEALILEARYDEAKEAFTRIVNDYPQDPKAPGALLKLGVVYGRMGDTQLARQVWRELPEKYPESHTEIRAAQDYLNRTN